MRSPTARAVVTAGETSRQRALIASSACPSGHGATCPSKVAVVTLDAACVRPGDPPLAAKLAAEVTDDLVLDGTAADATKVVTCTDRRSWMRQETLRHA